MIRDGALSLKENITGFGKEFNEGPREGEVKFKSLVSSSEDDMNGDAMNWDMNMTEKVVWEGIEKLIQCNIC